MPLTCRYKICVVMIVKDEHAYLEEFICYYLALGVDHFFIYDNGSSVPVTATLKFYLKYCTIIDFPGRARQLEAYNHFIRRFSRQTEWAAPIDADEFIVLRKHPDLKSFLESYSHFDCIALNWKYFGDNFFDQKPPGLVIDNFLLCQRGQDPHIKNLVRTSAWLFCENVHYLGLRPGSIYADPKNNPVEGPFNENYTLDIAQINHYFCKSRDECYRKYQKGRASRNDTFNLTEELFALWRNSMNQELDPFLKDRFSEKVKERMNKRQRKWLAF